VGNNQPCQKHIVFARSDAMTTICWRRRLLFKSGRYSRAVERRLLEIMIDDKLGLNMIGNDLE